MLKITVDESKTFRVSEEAHQWVINDAFFDVDLIDQGRGHYHAIHNNRSYRIEILERNLKDKTFRMLINGREYVTKAQDRLDLLLQEMGVEQKVDAKVNQLRAPMPGLIQSVLVSPGDEVKKGDNLLVLVAMKMENSIKASGDGRVNAVHVTTGQSVEKNQLLIEFG